MILGLRRPVRCEHVFDATADRPAVAVGVAEQEGDGNAAEGHLLAVVGIGVAAFDVDQCWTEGVAEAGGDGGEPALALS